MGPTETLANYVISSRGEALPSAVIEEGKRSFLNWLGVAIGASRHPTVDIALRTISEFAGREQASVLGRSERTDKLHAAFLNGLSSHVFDFDDTHLQTIIHPSGPVAPVVLALAEQRRVSGEELLHAFVLGIEVECRIGNAVYPSHYDVGWHITGTAGVFGAAAAAGLLLDADEARLAQALGIAASQASGLREMFGTMTKPFHVGHAAKNGLFAALLARNGFTSSPRSLEAPRGFAHVTSREPDFAELTDGLGDSYEVLKNSYKPFACGIVIHPSIDGCVQLRDRHGVRAGEVRRIELHVHPLVLELTGKKEPRSGLEGKFSVFHSAAVALIDGMAGEEQYSDERVLAPEVVALREKVHAIVSRSIREDEARVVVTLSDGTQREVHVEHALGSLERPMSNRDLEQKFRNVTRHVLAAEQADELIRLCWELDGLPDASVLVRSAIP